MQSGFTLMELLITVVCGGILLALAVPAFHTFMQNDQLWTAQSQLVMSLNAARSEAIKQDVTNAVQVCASADGKTCGGGNWSLGWIAINQADLANPVVIQSVGAAPTGTTVTEKTGNTVVTFLPNGTANQVMEFRICDARGGTQARYLQVNSMGRVASSSTPGYDLSSPPVGLVCP
jgi:prepilin-type N-terminal cleavage/methylation domain-containing protein